jgi:hypothetical protein
MAIVAGSALLFAVPSGAAIVEGPNNMGGIRGYAGVSIDPSTGHLWTATPNTWAFDPDCGCIVETGGYGEAALELDVELNLVAWNRPDHVANREDRRFREAPLLFQPAGCPPLAGAHAKNGRVYVCSREGPRGGPRWSAHVGPSGIDESFVSQPSYSPALGMFYISRARIRRRKSDSDAGRHSRVRNRTRLHPSCAATWTAPGVGRGPKSPPR